MMRAMLGWGPLAGAGVAAPRVRRAARCALAVAACLVLSACGVRVTDISSPASATPLEIRLALAPDPVWQWLHDSGAIARWERDHNLRLKASHPFDQFASFAGGHVDAAIVHAADVPLITPQSEQTPVIIGSIAPDRSYLAVDRTQDATSLMDLVEGRMAVASSFDSTLVWAVIADHMDHLDVSADSADFDVVIVERASLAEVVSAGDAEVCVCSPELSAGLLLDRQIRPLYGTESGHAALGTPPKPAAVAYAHYVLGDHAAGGARDLPLGDVLVASEDAYATQRGAIDALLELWQAGLDDWAANKRERIAQYPHLFSISGAEQIEWLQAYVEQYDWYARSVYISAAQSEVYADSLRRLRGLGLMPADAAAPTVYIARPLPDASEGASP